MVSLGAHLKCAPWESHAGRGGQGVAHAGQRPRVLPSEVLGEAKGNVPKQTLDSQN